MNLDERAVATEDAHRRRDSGKKKRKKKRKEQKHLLKLILWRFDGNITMSFKAFIQSN